MQKKWLFAVAIIAVCGVSLIGLIEDESDTDATSDVVTYYVQIANKNAQRVINIISNENYFESVDSNYSVSWKYWDYNANGEQDYQGLTVYGLEDTINDTECGDYSFNMLRESTGSYKLKITNTSDSSTSVQLRLKCSITVQLNDSLNHTLTYETEELNIHIMISLGSAAKPIVNYYNVSTESNPVEKNSIIVEEGKPVTLTPIIDNEPVAGSADDYNWYAIGLPKGLSMTSDGTIAGIPVQHTDIYIDPVIVYFEDKYGNGDSFQMHINVDINEFRSDIKYYMCDGRYEDTANRGTIVNAPVEYITQRDKVVTLAIQAFYSTEEPNGYSNPVSKIEVLSKNANEDKIERAELHYYTKTSGLVHYVYMIPTNGTGFYTIKMYDKSGVLCNNIDLYVMSKLVAVESAIIVGSDSSS